MTVAEPLPPEAPALLPVPLVLPVLEELDGLLLHAAVAAASASSAGADRVPGAFPCVSHSLAPLPVPVTVDHVSSLSSRVPGSGMAYIIKDPYALN